MMRTAGQTAGPIGLNFFVDNHRWAGVVFPNIFFPRATPSPSASVIQI